MSPLTFAVIRGASISAEHISACSELFCHNYGVWSDEAVPFSKSLRPGDRVKLPPSKLREQLGCLDGTDSALSTCHDGAELVGHAFATTWKYDQGTVCWITQLVVRSDHRRRGIATMLLQQLKNPDHTAFGIASSHGAACMALTRMGGIPIRSIDFSFIKAHAPTILQSTPVNYLKMAPLRGTLFENSPSNSAVISSVDTKFFVDHTEPLEVLDEYTARSGHSWPFGDLLEGCEFLVVVPAVASGLGLK